MIGMLIALAAGVAASPPKAPIRPGDRYVSLGSSYAAGPGVGMPDAASGACGRSQSNYARQIAQRRKLLLVDVACSGATTTNILDRGQNGFAAQIEAVTSDTRLVTILIGGNDVNYIGDLSTVSCRDTGGANCRTFDPGDLERRFAELPAKLDRVIQEVQRRAPDARIVLVGYLPTVPARGPGTCEAVPLTPVDAAKIRDIVTRLAQAFGQVAERHHVALVRSTLLGQGHDACSAEPYVTGYRPVRNPSWPSPVGYHPTQAGMDRVATALDRAIGS